MCCAVADAVVVGLVVAVVDDVVVGVAYSVGTVAAVVDVMSRLVLSSLRLSWTRR